ncbi:hypothetical protein KAU45_07265 [bacterium]|nr:hypothetical protein [bacterium]
MRKNCATAGEGRAARPNGTATGRVFYGALNQIGIGCNADRIGADIAAGTQTRKGYGGSGGPTTLFGDFMIRVHRRPVVPSVAETT